MPPDVTPKPGARRMSLRRPLAFRLTNGAREPAGATWRRRLSASYSSVRNRSIWGIAMAGPIASQLVVALGLLLAACAANPTPYQAAQGGFGYSQQQTEENRYRVTFAGNSATSR